MPFRRPLTLALAACAVLAPTASAEPVLGVDRACFAPAGNPAPGSPEWVQRDLKNQECASLRNRDQLASPAFGFGNLSQGAALYAEQTVDEAGHPTDPHGGITTRIPGAKAADPFRTLKRWTEAGRGRVAPIAFEATNGSTLRGHVFAPPASVPRPKGGFPGVVITDGSVQAYEELYFWAAQDLAEAGYVTMTYDVQGQGDSSLLGDDCGTGGTACSGVPYQQAYNFFQGAEDSLDVFVSAKNPFADLLDADSVGIAGHSLGANAVSHVGQCDTRVKTIVAWDGLDQIESCEGIEIPEEHRNRGELIRTSGLGMANDYQFNTVAHARTAPDRDAKTDGFEQVRDAGEDAQLVVIRNGTHLAYTSIPLVFQSNQLGERIASYYTRAWFDWKLKGSREGFERLTAPVFDESADTGIGAGVFDPAKVVPGDPYSGNVPYEIGGITVKDAVSFYYRSAYDLKGPGGRRVCEDVQQGC